MGCQNEECVSLFRVFFDRQDERDELLILVALILAPVTPNPSLT